MLSHEKCIELRDNGFPQPTFKSGQVWYRKRISTEVTTHPVPCIFIQKTPVLLDHFWVPIDGFGDAEFGRRDYVYCPTVEDMLSLLRFGYILTRTAEGNWCVFDLNARTILYWEKTPLEVLYEAWIDRRHLFEDMAGRKVGSEKARG